MLLALIVVVAIAIVIARGGQLSQLGSVEFQYLAVLFLPLMLQLLIFTPLVAYLPPDISASVIVYIASMFVGAIVVWFNRRLPGFRFLLAGLLSNLLVIVVNGGHMPVWAAARAMAGLPPLSGAENNVIPMGTATLLWFLADVLPVPQGIPLANVFSIGDVLITVGAVWFVQRVLRPPSPARTTLKVRGPDPLPGK